MKTRYLFQCVLVLTLLCGSVFAAATKKFTYDGSYASEYARNHAWKSYGSGSNQIPFYDFGNNCANFVSQAIIAGMIKQTHPQSVYNWRNDFTVDKSSSRAEKWFYISASNSSSGWRGANDMMNYAVYNKSTYRGLHFTFVASDRWNNRSLNPSNLRPGDVIFCDWVDNGSINHVLMVARIDSNTSLPKYQRIRVAGQSNPHVDTALQTIIDKSHTDDGGYPSFKVYRPTDYNQAGQ